VEAQKVVDRLLEADEADEFNARDYFAKTPQEEFDEAAASILKNARRLYAKLHHANVLGVAREPRRGALNGPDESLVAQAVLQLALERNGSPGVRRMYLRLKRYGRFLI